MMFTFSSASPNFMASSSAPSPSLSAPAPPAEADPAPAAPLSARRLLLKSLSSSSSLARSFFSIASRFSDAACSCSRDRVISFTLSA